MISLGDNASHRIANCSDTADMDARFVSEQLQSSNLPSHFTLGDHDIESRTSSFKNWLETTKRKELFYSFNEKDVHIIILDTTLGGEPMADSCEKDAECSEIEKRISELRNSAFEDYRQRYPGSEPSFGLERDLLKNDLAKRKSSLSVTRSWDNRDRGMISDNELKWLEEDLKSATSSRILIFSHAPLFKLISGNKVKDIVGGEKARDILSKSGKKIVAISGDAHLWHEEKQNNIQYYIIDEFRKSNGSWAYFTWDENGFRLEKEIH